MFIKTLLASLSPSYGPERCGIFGGISHTIPYHTIPSHGTVSREVTPDHFERYGIGNYWYHGMVWDISGICRGIP